MEISFDKIRYNENVGVFEEMFWDGLSVWDQFISQMMDYTGGMLFVKFGMIALDIILCVVFFIFMKKNQNTAKQKILMLVCSLMYFSMICGEIGGLFGGFHIISGFLKVWRLPYPGGVRLAAMKNLLDLMGNGLYFAFGIIAFAVVGCVISVFIVKKYQKKNKALARIMAIVFLALFALLFLVMGVLFGGYGAVRRLQNGWTPSW